MGDKRLLVKSGIAGIFFTGLVKLISFIYLVIIARLFLPADIGVFYLVISVLGIINIFSDLGVASTLTRYLPYFEGKNEKDKIWKTLELTVIGGLGLAVITTGLVFVFSNQIAEFVGAPEIAETLRMAAPYLILLEITGIGIGILNSRKRIFEPLFANFSVAFSKLVITLALFYILGATLISLVLGLLIASLIGAIYTSFSSIKEARKFGYEKAKSNMKEYLSFGKELFLFGTIVSVLNLFGNVIAQVNQIMIANLSTGDILTEVAIFAMAISFGTLLKVFPASLGRLLLPMSAFLYRKEEFAKIRELTETATKGGFLLTIPPAIIFIVFSKELLVLFYGPVYGAGWLVLEIFAVALLINLLSNYGRTVLTAMRMVGLEFRILFIAFVVLVISNIILIPEYGINGAAASFLISRVVVSALNYYYSRKTYGFRMFRGYWRVFLGALVISLIFLSLKGDIMTSIQDASSITVPFDDEFGIVRKVIKITLLGLLFASSFAIYFVVLFLMGGFGKDERRLFELMQSKLRKMIGWKRGRKQTN